MSIIEILEHLEIDYRTAGQSPHVTSNFVGVDCPYCGPDSGKHHLGFTLGPFLRVRCWRCGIHPVAETLIELSHKSWGEIRSLLGRLDRDGLPPSFDKPRGKLVLPTGIGPLLPCHRTYLASRRFDPDELSDIWGIQGIGLAPKLSWRVFIPITMAGKVVSWTTRKLNNEGVRYWSARWDQESYPHKELLSGEELVGHAIAICEGPFDMFRIGPGAVATCGIGFSQTQLARMVKYPLRLICFDNDDEAQRRAVELCRELSIHRGKTVNIRLRAKDPGSAGGKEIREIRRMLA